MTVPRRLHLGGPAVSAVGMGTWATGGPSWSGDQPLGWGRDWSPADAVAVLRAAFDAGITVYDTADAYGAGTAERLVGEALGDVRDEIAVVSKWGNVVDEPNRRLVGTDASPGYVRTALLASLSRLGTDHLDLYLLHLSGLPVDQADHLLGTLEDLVQEGLIGAYGWSTDDPERAAAWCGEPCFGAIEYEANAVFETPELIELTDRLGLPSLARGPLGMGLLGGHHGRGTRLTDDADFRRRSPDWLRYFRDGRPDETSLRRLEAIEAILTDGGRTLAQGALGWVLARSPHLIPIPGARTPAQARENARALELGPLGPEAMTAIDEALATTSPA